MKSVFRPIFAIALSTVLAACSHSSNSVMPMTGAQAGSSAKVQFFGQQFGNAAQVCGPVTLGEARCDAWIRTDVHSGIGSSSNNIFGYKPADLQAAYNLPSSTKGTGQTIAVVDAFDDPAAESDLGVYRSQFGLPACTTGNGCFRKAAQDGSTHFPRANGGWAQEISLDLDMVSAICPNCRIILVQANSASHSDLLSALDEAVALGATVISNSYGASEFTGETSFDA